MSNSVLTPVVAEKIWALDRPVWFAGVKLRVRTTVLRLDDGSLLLHSPAPPTEAMAAALRALGPVRWLVIPNCFHHLGTPAAAAHFPDAHVVGPRSALERNNALRLDMDIQGPEFTAEVDELEALPLQGVPFLDETVLFHRPTQTLLGADIVLCADAQDHWIWRWAGRITGCYERVSVPPDVKKEIADKGAAARSIQAILQRPAKRLIVGHAAVMGEGCLDQLAQAWQRVGVGVKGANP